MVAARLVVRRWPLYVLTGAVALGIEILFVTFVHVKLASFYAELIGTPIIGCIVLVNAGADAAGVLVDRASRVERIVERAWAILVLDVATTFVYSTALSGMLSGDTGDRILGVLVLFVTSLLLYAEPFAALDERAQTLTVIPFAVLRSMMLSWVNLSRIFSLLAIEIVLQLGLLELDAGVAPMGGYAVDVASLAYVAIVTIPLSALFAVAYLDTLAQERRLLRR